MHRPDNVKICFVLRVLQWDWGGETEVMRYKIDDFCTFIRRRKGRNLQDNCN